MHFFFIPLNTLSYNKYMNLNKTGQEGSRRIKWGQGASKGVKGNEGGQVVRISLKVKLGGRERGWFT